MIDSETAARKFVSERCDSAALERLELLIELLREENGRQNLVAERSLREVWRRHIADSAQLLDHVPRETGPWLDLGTGAGFPGMVVACMRPDLRVTLVESRKRRIEWLSNSAEALSLPLCRVAGSRLEDIPSLQAAVISARAFAPLAKLVSLAQRFSTADTLWLLPKGRTAAQEVATLDEQLRGSFHVEPSATDEDSGIVVGHGVKGHK